MRQVTVLALTLLCSVSARAECEVNGQVYQVGEEFRRSPCESCRCEENGGYYCAAARCGPPPPCVDWEYTDEYCCGFCFNGRNCGGPHGLIISEGEEVEISNGARCSCDFNHMSPILVCMLPA